jgi:transcriptional regulator with XRE-family HTH domain
MRSCRFVNFHLREYSLAPIMRVRKKSRPVTRLKKPTLDPVAVALGRRLRTARLKKKMSQTKLAKLAEVSPITLFRNEKGEAHAELATLRKYAQHLGTTLEYLLGSEAVAIPMAPKEAPPAPSSTSQDTNIPLAVARLIALIPNVTDEELTYLARYSRLEEGGATTEELETTLLGRRLGKDPSEENRKAFNDHLERRALDDGMRPTNPTPKKLKK